MNARFLNLIKMYVSSDKIIMLFAASGSTGDEDVSIVRDLVNDMDNEVAIFTYAIGNGI